MINQEVREDDQVYDPFSQRIALEVTELSSGYARVEKTVTPEDVNPLGVPHGGVYFSMADTACGRALMAAGQRAVTVNASYNFFSSARIGDHLTAVARQAKGGRTVCVYEVQVTNQNGVLLGTGTFTFYNLEAKKAQ